MIDYLNGFSDNVQEIINKFKFRNQLETLVEHKRLYALIQKFTDSDINLSPEPIKDKKGKVIQPGLSNLGMGYVFEELIRKFNGNSSETGSGKIYAVNYNILRIMSGMGGLAYSN